MPLGKPRNTKRKQSEGFGPKHKRGIPVAPDKVNVYHNDRQGKMLIEKKVIDASTIRQRNVDLSSFGKGVYLISSWADGKIYSGKVVIY